MIEEYGIAKHIKLFREFVGKVLGQERRQARGLSQVLEGKLLGRTRCEAAPQHVQQQVLFRFCGWVLHDGVGSWLSVDVVDVVLLVARWMTVAPHRKIQRVGQQAVHCGRPQWIQRREGH